jgi:hypothetical protein
MIKKRPILDIIDLVKDKERFSKEEPELQNEIFQFFRNSRNLKRKQEKVKKLEILITKEKNNIKKLSKDKTKGFVYITDELSIGKKPIDLKNIEDRNPGIRVDVVWKSDTKRVTLGKTLKEVYDLCKKYKPSLNKKINKENYKQIIEESLRNVFIKKISTITRDEFKHLDKIKINPKTFEIEFIQSKDELEKGKDKPTKKPPTLDSMDMGSTERTKTRERQQRRSSGPLRLESNGYKEGKQYNSKSKGSGVYSNSNNYYSHQSELESYIDELERDRGEGYNFVDEFGGVEY